MAWPSATLTTLPSRKSAWAQSARRSAKVMAVDLNLLIVFKIEIYSLREITCGVLLERSQTLIPPWPRACVSIFPEVY